MALDVVRARRETPGCANVLHFNNAGAALMPEPVVDALIEHLELEARIGGYEAAERAREASEHAYDAIAGLLGCHRDEVAIVENATRAWDMAFYSLPLQRGDRILTSPSEYASNYIAFLQLARRTGVVIDVVPHDEHGQISIRGLRDAIDHRTKLIAITHVPSNSGLVNPAAEVGRVARDARVLYLLDACQSIGQLPVRVEKIGCHMLSATGRKYLRGPRATGFLYVEKDLVQALEPVFLDLHAAPWVAANRYEIRKDARRFESWESNCAGRIALGVAVDYALQWGIEAIWERVSMLAERLRARLGALEGVRVRDPGLRKCGIVTFTIDGKEPEEIKSHFATQRINVTVASQGVTRLDMEARQLAGVVRASVHYYNTEEEIERFCVVLAALK